MNILKKIIAILNKKSKKQSFSSSHLNFFSTFLDTKYIGIILPILHVLSKGKVI